MSKKTERIRSKLDELKEALAEAEKAEKQQRREEARRALARAARRSGLLAVLQQAEEGTTSLVLEQEFRRVANVIHDGETERSTVPRTEEAPKQDEDGSADGRSGFHLGLRH